MKKIIFKLLIFLSPFIFISLFIFIVDPYNFLNISHVFSDEIKLKCINRSNESIPRGTILWKTLEFRRNPSQNIMVGDSRAAYISNSALEKNFGEKSSNLAVAGSNYRSAIELFWMAARTTTLKNVIFQTNFDTYNVEGSSLNIFTATEQLINKPTSYFFNWTFIKDAFAVLYYAVSKNEKFVSRGFIRSSDNWEKSAKGLDLRYNLKHYKYPVGLTDELKKISKYCSDNNINFMFVIPPDYFEVVNYVEEHGISDYYNRFKTDLKMTGKTIDLDTKLPFSFVKENYADHFHIRFEIADTLVSMIFANLETEQDTNSFKEKL
jgi:hypothetical protein